MVWAAISEIAQSGLLVCAGLACAEPNFEEMLEDSHEIYRLSVRITLVRFFKIPKDSHYPLMWKSSCSSRGDASQHGFSASDENVRLHKRRLCWDPETDV